MVDEPKRHKPQTKGQNSYSLPPCARIILKNGVSQYQRVSCFRLAVHLKMTGIPEDIAKVVLTVWASKNQPKHGKRTITETEIIEQVSYAYSKNYRGYGCGSEAIAPFCDPNCPVNKLRKRDGG